MMMKTSIPHRKIGLSCESLSPFIILCSIKQGGFLDRLSCSDSEHKSPLTQQTV